MFYFVRLFPIVISCNPSLLYPWSHKLAMKPISPQRYFYCSTEYFFKKQEISHKTPCSWLLLNSEVRVNPRPHPCMTTEHCPSRNAMRQFHCPSPSLDRCSCTRLCPSNNWTNFELSQENSINFPFTCHDTSNDLYYISVDFHLSI